MEKNRFVVYAVTDGQLSLNAVNITPWSSGFTFAMLKNGFLFVYSTGICCASEFVDLDFSLALQNPQVLYLFKYSFSVAFTFS